MRIADRIKQIRETKGLSQKEFAETLNTALTRISEYERDKVKPTTEILTKLAEIHKININWLLTGTGNMFLDQKSDDGEFADLIEALNELPERRQKYYYFKIMAESLEADRKEIEEKEAKGVFAYPQT